MAEQKHDEAVTRGELEAFGEKIAEGITKGFKETMRPRVTIGEYVARNRKKVKLNKEVYQNGARVSDHVLTEGEIAWLNKLHRPGRYLDRKVEVISKSDDSENPVLWIRYSDKTIDQRLENKSKFANFEQLVKNCVLEQDVIEENERAREAKLARL